MKTCNEENILKLEYYLESRSYVLGYEPSSLDRDICIAIKERKISSWQNLPNVERWFNHIKSFSEDDQRRFTVPFALYFRPIPVISKNKWNIQ